jgi:16S rRNA (cytosine1402-N4)-methyltransferase
MASRPPVARVSGGVSTPENASTPQHAPVLADAVINHLDLTPGSIVADVTVGLGGHALRIMETLGNTGRLIGLDVDERNLAIARERLAHFSQSVTLLRRNFSELRSVLDELGISGVQGILADLGVSSNQLEDATRGLSFMDDGPLDMRLDDRLARTATDLVNALSERELADLFWFNSQERFSRRIAKRICQERREARIRRTSQLARIVCSAVGVDPDSRKSRIHPATRVFQALRMAVNDEVGNLQAFLDSVVSCLAPGEDSRCGPSHDTRETCGYRGGRVAVISFHSVEDGLVKKAFRRHEAEGRLRICTKKPITPDALETARNPRARSAKLRVAQRVEDAAANA